MPKSTKSTNGVPTEAQVKAAIKRGDSAATEIESSLTELRDLSEQLNTARNITTDRLVKLLNGQPPQGAMPAGRQY